MQYIYIRNIIYPSCTSIRERERERERPLRVCVVAAVSRQKYANLQSENQQRAALGSAPLQPAASCMPVDFWARPRGWQRTQRKSPCRRLWRQSVNSPPRKFVVGAPHFQRKEERVCLYCYTCSRSDRLQLWELGWWARFYFFVSHPWHLFVENFHSKLHYLDSGVVVARLHAQHQPQLSWCFHPVQNEWLASRRNRRRYLKRSGPRTLPLCPNSCMAPLPCREGEKERGTRVRKERHDCVRRGGEGSDEASTRAIAYMSIQESCRSAWLLLMILAAVSTSSIGEYNNDVGPIYSQSKKKNCFISFIGIYSPLYRHRYCTHLLH